MSYITDTSTPASKVIHLDSAHAHVRYLKDDEGNELTTNFLYHMNEAIVCPSHLSMICSLHTATIPYTFYNVRGASTTSVNNHLILTYFNAGTGITTTYKLVFPSGSYKTRNSVILSRNNVQLDQPLAPSIINIPKSEAVTSLKIEAIDRMNIKSV